MKLIAQCFFSGCLMLLATVPASSQTLWYSGDTTGPSTYSNSVYQDFIIPAQVPGWQITGVFSNNYFADGTLSPYANWEIRSDMTAGGGGQLVASGSTSQVASAATGRTATVGGVALTEYTIQIDGLSLPLPPGHYWVTVTPQPAGSPSPTASETSGANCVGTPCGSGGDPFFLNQSFVFAPVSGVNFSMGVTGSVATSPVPPVLCQVNVGVPPVVRAEGIAEPIGDIVLSCTGGTPTAASDAIPTVTFQVSLNTKLTSLILSGSSGSEAMLLIDEPNAGSMAVPSQSVVAPPATPRLQELCASPAEACEETVTAGHPSPYQTQPNVFMGQQTPRDTIT